MFFALILNNELLFLYKSSKNSIEICQISDNLILCTCADEDQLKDAPYTWRLYSGDQEFDYMVGVMFPSPELRYDVVKNNYETLLNRLNNFNCFDKEIDLKEGDQLKLYFKIIIDEKNISFIIPNSFNSVLGQEVRSNYEFVFKSGKWEEKRSFMQTGLDYQFGIVKNAFNDK